jgi:hypothetical protein
MTLADARPGPKRFPETATRPPSAGTHIHFEMQGVCP